MSQPEEPRTIGDSAWKSSQEMARTLPRVVYEPDSHLRHPVQLIKEMWQDLLAARELAWQLLRRDISAQYRQSVLGIIWAFIPPIVTALGLTLAKNFKILNLGTTDIPYPAYVMLSMSLWQTFTASVNSMMGVAKNAKGILSKLRVPPEAFVLARLGQILFDFGLRVIPIAFFFLWFHVSVTWSLLLAPVALLHLIMLGMGIGLILGPLATLYGDVGKLWGYFMKLWLFLTPVIYQAPKQGIIAILLNLNPVTPLLVTARELATTGIVSEPIGFWLASFLAFFSLLVGWLVYRLAMPFLVERA